VAALAGRAHFYEGHDLSTVAFPIRVMGRLGVTQVILTNAA
jgi:purine-nucleoside phosphorylase